MTQTVSRSLQLTSLALSSGLFLTATTAARADDQTPLPTVVVSGTVEKDSAVTQAPTMAPLTVTEPTSLLSQYYIENNMAPSANYDDVVKIAPSVYSVSPNGPGLAESQALCIRGFCDGFFNVTFDGIPWGDSNDFTHHSTSYYMGHDLGTISVDRGPGTAATVGNATFGGTLAINSKSPLADTTVTPYFSYGSFNTSVVGGEFDTGPLEKYNGAAGFIDGESLSSDGYLTNLGIDRKNVFTKFAVPVNDNTVVTFVGMYNEVTQYISLGTTAAEIAQFGPNYGLSRDPTKQNYYGYNNDHIHDDFEYIGVVSNLGGWVDAGQQGVHVRLLSHRRERYGPERWNSQWHELRAERRARPTAYQQLQVVGRYAQSARRSGRRRRKRGPLVRPSAQLAGAHRG